MRTRRAFYPSPRLASIPCTPESLHERSNLFNSTNFDGARSPKRRRLETHQTEQTRNAFDALPDDLLVSIMMSVSSTATSPSDLINIMITCKRLYLMGLHRLVLANAALAALAVKASRWSDGAHRFLKRCADSGNAEACFILGMIQFFCLRNRSRGVFLMAKAAMVSHAGALHSLAIIQFNGSGGSRKDKNLEAGATLCARAAIMGHVDSMRELGHCLQDGYGVPRNVLEGRRLMLEANAREVAAALASCPKSFSRNASRFKMNKELVCLYQRLHSQSVKRNRCAHKRNGRRDLASVAAYAIQNRPAVRFLRGDCCSLLSDFGCNVPPAQIHECNKFLVEWFALHPLADGLRLCSHANCGRPETRKHEFRRCSACGTVNYCSRACQALDWKLCHKYDCQPIMQWDQDRDESDEEDQPEELVEDNSVTDANMDD